MIQFVWCYVIDTGSEASVVASCDGEPHTLHTHGPYCCFHYRISTTFPTFLLYLSDSTKGFLGVSCSYSLFLEGETCGERVVLPPAFMFRELFIMQDGALKLPQLLKRIHSAPFLYVRVVPS